MGNASSRTATFNKREFNIWIYHLSLISFAWMTFMLDGFISTWKQSWELIPHLLRNSLKNLNTESQNTRKLKIFKCKPIQIHPLIGWHTPPIQTVGNPKFQHESLSTGQTTIQKFVIPKINHIHAMQLYRVKTYLGGTAKVSPGAPGRRIQIADVVWQIFEPGPRSSHHSL